MLFESSKSGDRFAESVIKFNTSDNTSNYTKTQSISINRNVKFQKIVGIGGALTDSTGINIAKLPDSVQIRIIEDLFGQNGSEYSLARIPIAGSDYSSRLYSYDDVKNDEKLVNFSLTEDDYRYKVKLCIDYDLNVIF